MSYSYRSALFAIVCVAVSPAYTYELYTHAAITREAYGRSVLMDPIVLNDMGLSAESGFLGRSYYDVQAEVARLRTETPFEREIIRKVGTDELTLQGWLMRGAVREDDIPLPLGDNPQDVPPPDEPFYRVFNHFYDPVYNRPLTVPASFQSTVELLNGGAVHTALDWATGTIGTFGANIDRRNHFTLVDAREAMYRAATGRDSGSNTNIGPDNTPATEAVRKAYWATVFRSLGDVVHLVQDMGQPQHTRNDGHSPVNKVVQGDHIGVFEELTEHRAGGKKFTCFDGNQATGVPSLVFSNYVVPTFPSYGEAFSTTPGGNVAQGRGLADYSNRGFFSAGKNLGNTEYALPSSNPADYSRQTVTDPNPCLPSGRQAEVLRGTVPDLMGGSNTNVALTSRGLWDVPGYTIPREEAKYSMNETVYYENADLLVTRAASYSAGLINYFFRGKIDFIVDPQNSAQHIIRNLGTEEMAGTFALYYDDANGIRHPVPGANWQLILPAGLDSTPVTFTTPTAPTPANSDYYLVFNGRMGNESPSTNSVGAVAVKYIHEYWEPWGEALMENHGWEHYTGPYDWYGGPFVPMVPIDGVLTLDTRVVTERGTDYCAIFDPETRECQYASGVERAIWFCGDESCSTPLEGITANVGFLRIRLKAESNYANSLSENGCGEWALIQIVNRNLGSYTIVYVDHVPDEPNQVVPFSANGYGIYNNGTFAEYVIPIDSGVTDFSIISRDGRDAYDEEMGFTCHDSYFSLDIDYIDFIP